MAKDLSEDSYKGTDSIHAPAQKPEYLQSCCCACGRHLDPSDQQLCAGSVSIVSLLSFVVLLSSCGMRVSHCSGFSCCGAQALCYAVLTRSVVSNSF